MLWFRKCYIMGYWALHNFYVKRVIFLPDVICIHISNPFFNFLNFCKAMLYFISKRRQVNENLLHSVSFGNFKQFDHLITCKGSQIYL